MPRQAKKQGRGGMKVCKCEVELIYGGETDDGMEYATEGEIKYCPLHAAAPELLEAMQSVINWFDRMKKDHHEKLLHNQTLESAAENWNNLLQEPLEIQPFKDLIAKANPA